MEKNNLKKFRISMGLTITALSRLSNVSAKVISETERFIRNPTVVTKRKILNGLNAARGPQEKKLQFEEIFPDPPDAMDS